MNHNNCRRKKNELNKLFDLNQFDEWFAMTYKPVNCGGLPVPKMAKGLGGRLIYMDYKLKHKE
jgi:hypothetical protein